MGKVQTIIAGVVIIILAAIIFHFYQLGEKSKAEEKNAQHFIDSIQSEQDFKVKQIEFSLDTTLAGKGETSTQRDIRKK